MFLKVNLHNKIFSSLIQAPIVFFDKTPGILLKLTVKTLNNHFINSWRYHEQVLC